MKKINIRKGSYHEYCRNRFQSQSAHEPKRIKLAKMTNRDHKVQDF